MGAWPPTVKTPVLIDNVFSKMRGLALEFALSKEYISGACRRFVESVGVAAGGSVANSTTYTMVAFTGRATKVTGIYAYAITAPIGGTNTIAVANSATTNTMLSAATFDPTTLVSGTVKSLPLTSVAADLVLPATGVATITYVAGTQATAGVGVKIIVEFENNDF